MRTWPAEEAAVLSVSTSTEPATASPAMASIDEAPTFGAALLCLAAAWAASRVPTLRFEDSENTVPSPSVG